MLATQILMTSDLSVQCLLFKILNKGVKTKLVIARQCCINIDVNCLCLKETREIKLNYIHVFTCSHYAKHFY